MKLVVTAPREIEAAAIRVCAAVRYDEEDIPSDFPFRRGEVWDVTVDVDTGKIRDWPQGRAAGVHMKVCDQGSYYLLDPDGRQLAAIEEDYVPGCIPGSYGDYIEFDIAEDGTVAKWKSRCTADGIADSFFRCD